MADKVVSDNFSIYDVFVRFGPGSILVACFYYGYKSVFPDAFDGNIYLKLIVYVALSYIVGSLSQALVRWSKEKLNNWYFGGNPRSIYTGHKKGKEYVLHREKSRELAGKCTSIIIKHVPLEISTNPAVSSGEGEDEISEDQEKANHFAFGYMTNYLDVQGLSSKNSRVNSFADMCASIAVTIVLCDIICLAARIGQHLVLGKTCVCSIDSVLPIVIAGVISVIGYLSSCKLYRSYIQMRFAIVVYQFAIHNEWMKQESKNT